MMNDPSPLLTDLYRLKELALEREAENDAFKDFLSAAGDSVDDQVISLHDAIAPRIDCLQCANCCKSLLIHVEPPEAERLAQRLDLPLSDVYDRYLEKGSGGDALISAIPCHFLEGNRCSIYEDRFAGCRSFPHLDSPGFRRRLFATFQQYGRCPIVYNVLEQLKLITGFRAPQNSVE